MFLNQILIAQTDRPIIKANSLKVDVLIGDKLLKQSWTITPDLKLDVFKTSMLNKKVTFYIDLDSISVVIKKDTEFEFIILLNNSIKAFTQIKYDPIRNRNKFDVLLQLENVLEKNNDYINQPLLFVDLKQELEGEIVKETIWSSSLGEHRKLTIYLPPKYNKLKEYPVIYIADGSNAAIYAHFIEYLILKRDIEDIIIVGVHSSEASAKDLGYKYFGGRTLEYIRGFYKDHPGFDSNLYDKHLVFFCEEVIRYISKKYNEVTSKRSISGNSDGASFVLTASLSYPNLYANVLPFSVSGTDEITPDEYTNIESDYYFTAGNLEIKYLRNTLYWLEHLDNRDINVSFEAYHADHSMLMWANAFYSYVGKIYSIKH